MTDEQLLIEAERRYPPGTKYWNLNLVGARSNPDADISDLPVRPTKQKFKFLDRG